MNAPGVLCACPGGSEDDQTACGRACVVGFATGDTHASQRATCTDCGRLTINVSAETDVEVDSDDDPNTPPVVEPLAYALVGQAGLVNAESSSGKACTATIVLDETVPPFNFSFTFENHDHGTVTQGCL